MIQWLKDLFAAVDFYKSRVWTVVYVDVDEGCAEFMTAKRLSYTFLIPDIECREISDNETPDQTTYTRYKLKAQDPARMVAYYQREKS